MKKKDKFEFTKKENKDPGELKQVEMVNKFSDITCCYFMIT